MRTGNILANSLRLISKRQYIYKKKSSIVSYDWTESESHTSILVLEHTVHFEARLVSECPEGHVGPQLLSVAQVCMQDLAVPNQFFLCFQLVDQDESPSDS